VESAVGLSTKQSLCIADSNWTNYRRLTSARTQICGDGLKRRNMKDVLIR